MGSELSGAAGGSHPSELQEGDHPHSQEIQDIIFHPNHKQTAKICSVFRLVEEGWAPQTNGQRANGPGKPTSGHRGHPEPRAQTRGRISAGPSPEEVQLTKETPSGHPSPCHSWCSVPLPSLLPANCSRFSVFFFFFFPFLLNQTLRQNCNEFLIASMEQKPE